MGGGFYSTSRPAHLQKMYEANLAVSINHKGIIYVDKNRYGRTGEVGLVDLLTMLISCSNDYSLTGSKLLDTPVKDDLLKAIDGVLEKHNL